MILFSHPLTFNYVLLSPKEYSVELLCFLGARIVSFHFRFLAFYVNFIMWTSGKWEWFYWICQWNFSHQTRQFSEFPFIWLPSGKLWHWFECFWFVFVASISIVALVLTVDGCVGVCLIFNVLMASISARFSSWSAWTKHFNVYRMAFYVALATSFYIKWQFRARQKSWK